MQSSAEPEKEHRMSDDPRNEFNPYSPPSPGAVLYSEGPDGNNSILADRITRLGAA
jgi:hypothetical protein